MRLLALDQATVISGWSIFEDGKLIKYGKIETNTKDIGERLYYIKQQILNLIAEYQIDEIVLEDIQMQNNVVNNVQTFKALAELFGVLAETFTEIKMPYSALLASSWKSTLGIKGKNRQEQKKNAQIWVQNTYSVKPTQDECDAVCIGSAYLKRQDSEFDWS